jgi:putative aldouronate transport system permease protein
MPLPKGSALYRRVARNYDLYLFLLPALIYFIVFCYWPMYGLQIAFKDFIAGRGIAESPWVGLKHFIRFVSGPNFGALIRNTLVISLGSLLFGFPISVIWALVLNEVPFQRFRKAAQVVSYLPYFISTVVMSSVIILFLNKNYGLVNKMAGLVGLGPYDFITVSKWFPAIYVISGIWQLTGWNSIVYVSSLAGVDPELHEAAMIDGATRMQRMWHINIPYILPTVVIMFIMSAGRIMSVGFEKVFLLQNSLNLPNSEIISTYVYKAGLLQVQYSFSAAVGLFNNVINFILLLTVNRISRRVSGTSLW